MFESAVLTYRFLVDQMWYVRLATAWHVPSVGGHYWGILSADRLRERGRVGGVGPVEFPLDDPDKRSKRDKLPF